MNKFLNVNVPLSDPTDLWPGIPIIISRVS